MKFGVVGDDITGCVDIGLMFHKGNIECDVFTKDSTLCKRIGVEAVIVDTDSRFTDSALAYQRVYDRVKELKELGTERYYKKTCSVFRGNIGAEFDAMLDASGENFALIVAGFPETGRTTIHSKQYIDGILLENSQFKNDPMNPMRHSDLREIIHMQSSRKAAKIWWEELDKGVAYVKERISCLRKEYSYVCADVRDRHDLMILARASEEVTVFGGSSALALELAMLNANRAVKQEKQELPDRQKGILCVCGSVTKQSAQQIKMFQLMDDTVSFAVSPDELLKQKLEIDSLIQDCAENILHGRNVLLYTEGTGDAERIRTMQNLAEQFGMSKEQFGILISDTLAEITHRVQNQTRQNRLIFAGGETSFHGCQRLGVNDLQIQDEVEPGIPACIGIGKKTYLLILKSGSFGSDYFFSRAVSYLKEN